MNILIKKTLLFLIPLVLLGVTLEVFITLYPNSYNTKSSFLKNNKDIELLILGSSHSQNGINPEYLDMKSVNLAHGSQDIKIDEAMFNRYVYELHNLKYLILELDYHRLEDSNSSNFYRLAWYYRYYGVEIDTLPLVEKISLYASSPSFFQRYLKNIVFQKGEDLKLNTFGFNLVDDGVFKELNYDKKRIDNTADIRLENRHSEVSLSNYKTNKKLVNKIISKCKERGITVFICASPLYYTYKEREVFEKELRRNNYMDSILKFDNDVIYFNLETDNSFLITDYKNDDHLNSKGAEKYTKLLNIKLDSIIKIKSTN